MQQLPARKFPGHHTELSGVGETVLGRWVTHFDEREVLREALGICSTEPR